MTISTTRRGFLQSALAGAAVLVVGLRPDGSLAAGTGEGALLNPFVRIGADGQVTAIIKHFEMGQGPSTGLTTLIAEELGVSMEAIDYEFAPSDATLYGNLFLGPIQGTGGSTAMANSFMQYRSAGAAARAVLIAAAAQTWGVDAEDLDIIDGQVTGAGKTAPLGDFVAVAATLTPPAEPKLKDPSAFRLIGNASIKRKDSAIKVNGRAKFAMDMHLDNQMVVVLARTPQRGGLVASFDDTGAKEVKGFIRAATLPNNAAVAVYAESTWAALQARDALMVEWDNAAAEIRGSDEIRAEALAAVAAEPTYNVNGADQTAIAALIDGAAQVVEQSFYFPLLAHAPMEPMTCTIEATAEGGIRLYDGCQMPTIPHMAFAQIFDLPMEKIEIVTMLAGGSFGRRANADADYQVEAALAFVMTDRSRPVKLVWFREDDIQNGYYRPVAAHRVRVGLDEAGKIVGWDHRIASQSIMKGTFMEQFAIKDGVDTTSVEGVHESPYSLPGMAIGLTDVPKATNVLWWRSVGHTHTGYVMESMMDMVAAAAGRDPVEYRLDYLGEGEEQARIAGVLKLAAEKAGWGIVAEGRKQGIAVHKSFGTYVAEVVEVSGSADDGVTIEKVTCAVDCGIAVNPDMIRAQMEGGIGYGIGHAMRDAITLTGGVVDQSNFPDYEPLRITDIGAIEVHIVPSNAAPSGVGEPGVPPSAPALANAIFAATGKRITALPMSDEVDFV